MQLKLQGHFKVKNLLSGPICCFTQSFHYVKIMALPTKSGQSNDNSVQLVSVTNKQQPTELQHGKLKFLQCPLDAAVSIGFEWEISTLATNTKISTVLCKEFRSPQIT